MITQGRLTFDGNQVTVSRPHGDVWTADELSTWHTHLRAGFDNTVNSYSANDDGYTIVFANTITDAQMQGIDLAVRDFNQW